MHTKTGWEPRGQHCAGNDVSGDTPITIAETIMATIAIAAVAAFLVLTADCIKRWGEGGFWACLIAAVTFVLAIGAFDSARERRSSRHQGED